MKRERVPERILHFKFVLSEHRCACLTFAYLELVSENIRHLLTNVALRGREVNVSSTLEPTNKKLVFLKPFLHFFLRLAKFCDRIILIFIAFFKCEYKPFWPISQVILEPSSHRIFWL